MGCHAAKTIIQLPYILFKIKVTTGPGLQRRWVCSAHSAHAFCPGREDRSRRALPTFWVQKGAGLNTVGKHTLGGTSSHPNGGGQHFYYVFCRDTNHQMEDSKVIFRVFFWIFCHGSHLFWFASSVWKTSHPLYTGLLNLLDWLVGTWQTSRHTAMNWRRCSTHCCGLCLYHFL